MSLIVGAMLSAAEEAKLRLRPRYPTSAVPDFNPLIPNRQDLRKQRRVMQKSGDALDPQRDVHRMLGSVEILFTPLVGESGAADY